MCRACRCLRSACIYDKKWNCSDLKAMCKTMVGMWIRTHTQTQTNTHTHTHARAHTNTHIHILDTHTHIQTHAHTHTHTHTHTNAHIHIRTHTLSYIHIHCHTHINTHTHTHSGARTHTRLRTLGTLIKIERKNDVHLCATWCKHNICKQHGNRLRRQRHVAKMLSARTMNDIVPWARLHLFLK